ncbi:MAG: glutathione peroxidase [Solirubrobacteraceae bacterium]|nr:glutathione peroxidase [Solirubrobacteraceae bacterium]
MRFVSVIVLGCAALAGCGGGADEPVGARDASVQRPAAAGEGSDAARPAGGGVLRGTYTRLDGRRDDLARYRGDVVLVVNTATECGYTPQLAGLQALYRERRSDGLVVLGFPANDFAGQEPRSDEEIAEFCEANYGVTFPMFAKTVVAGERANPLFRRLGAAVGAPEWNFNKYLVDRRGKVVARFGAGIEPDAPELVQRVDALL